MNAQPSISTASGAKATGAFFRWEIPGEALGVNLHLNIIELIERDALRAGHRFAAGVLLGRFDRGRDLTMTIEHYAAATPERGAADCPFGDSERVRLMLDRWRPGKSRMSIIGLYRTCADQEAVLNEDDLAALCASVGPGSEPETATGYAESADRRVTAITGGYAPAESTRPNPAESAATEAGDRVFLLIEPRPDKISTAVLYLARDGEVVYQSPPIAFNRGEISKMAAPDQPRAPQAARTPSAPQNVVVRDTVEAELPPRWKLADLLAYFNNFYRLLGAAAVLVLLMAGYVQLRSNNSSNSDVPQALPASSADPGANPDLGLKLERLGTDWRLKWDTSSSAFLNATGGHLEITDGTLRKNVDLNASDLRGGSIVYSPLTNDVVLRLEIDSANSPPVSESVRSLGGLPSPLSSAGVPDVPALPDAQIAPSRLGPSIDTSPASVITQTQAPTGLPAASVMPTEMPKPHGIDLPGRRDFEQPAAKRNNHPTASRLDQPMAEHVNQTPDRHTQHAEPRSDIRPADAKAEPVVERSPVATLTISGTEPSVAAPEAPPQPALAPRMARTLPEAASPVPVLESVRKGGVVQPAQLISHPDPVYPPEARKQGISGAVEVRFKINTNGSVYNVTVVRGPSVLAQAAIDAVQARKYKPARVDGVPTETEASAIFNFRLN